MNTSEQELKEYLEDCPEGVPYPELLNLFIDQFSSHTTFNLALSRIGHKDQQKKLWFIKTISLPEKQSKNDPPLKQKLITTIKASNKKLSATELANKLNRDPVLVGKLLTEAVRDKEILVTRNTVKKYFSPDLKLTLRSELEKKIKRLQTEAKNLGLILTYTFKE